MRKIQLRVCSVAILLSCLAFAQGVDKDAVWRDAVEWIKSQPGPNFPSMDAFRAEFMKRGLTEAQANERIELIGKLSQEPKYQQEASALYFNRLYRTPTQTRFTMEPNAFLASTIKDLKPGKALDIAMGQGRNAVYVASKGWDVTGYDLAEEGMKVAQENAAKAGVKVTTVKAGFEDFDYGKERWDLIYFVYTDAPMVDAKFVERVVAALKPGGLVLVDRPYRSLTNPEPGWRETDQDKPNALPKAWSALQLLFYEDTTGYADWQQTQAPRLEEKRRIVRMLARKM